MKKLNREFNFSVKGKKQKKEYKLLKELLFISEEIYNARQALGINQEDLAKKANTTQKIISKIENADLNFGIDLILRITRALNIQLMIGGFLSLPEMGDVQRKNINFTFHEPHNNLEDIEPVPVKYTDAKHLSMCAVSSQSFEN
jgi:transcriptional regulator with XRE-family HTH domain